MKCAACNYEDHAEVNGVEIYYGTFLEITLSSSIPFIQNKTSQPLVKLYACPRCGTVRMKEI